MVGTFEPARASGLLTSVQDPVLNFGKHKGMRLSTLPEDYLRFMVREHTTAAGVFWPRYAEQELARRAIPFVSPDQSVPPSLHAIDRFSTLCLRHFLEREDQHRGLGMAEYLGYLGHLAYAKGEVVDYSEARNGEYSVTFALGTLNLTLGFPSATAEKPHTIKTVRPRDSTPEK